MLQLGKGGMDMLHAKIGVLTIRNTKMEYIRFGFGERILIMLPGLGDGLRTVKGTALPMALMYRMFARDFTVYMFSRLADLPEGYTTRDMARDQKDAMDLLGIEKADVLGVSMGGMIAQHLAADYPERVNKLVLTVTCFQPNPILQESVTEWIHLAKQDNHAALMDSNLRRIYSDAYYRKNKWMVPSTGLLTKPKSYDRFFVQAQACLNHNAFDKLTCIQSPTLVIGGEQDKALGGEASRELAAHIPGAQLRMYPQWGHGVYEEEPEFNRILLSFLLGA